MIRINERNLLREELDKNGGRKHNVSKQASKQASHSSDLFSVKRKLHKVKGIFCPIYNGRDVPFLFKPNIS